MDLAKLNANTTIVALPAQINTILDLIKTVSQWMFGLFLTAAPLNFILMFVVPLSITSRWVSLPIAIFTFLGALITTVATVIATVMFIIMKNAITSATQLNIKADLGVEMFVFMWIAAVASILAWLIQMGMCCCCASRRDVRRGKRKGSKKAWNTATPDVNEKSERRGGLPVFRKTKKQEE